MLDKPNCKRDRNRKKQDRDKRRKENSMTVRVIDGFKCSNFMHVHKIIPTELDCCHIVNKRPHAPWLDIPENSLLLCRYCHRIFDGQTPSSGMTTREYQIWIIRQHHNKVDFRHSDALLFLEDKITQEEYENRLKEIYYKNMEVV